MRGETHSVGDPPGMWGGEPSFASRIPSSPSQLPVPAADNHGALEPNAIAYAPPGHPATLTPPNALTTNTCTNALYDQRPDVQIPPFTPTHRPRRHLAHAAAAVANGNDSKTN